MANLLGFKINVGVNMRAMQMANIATAASISPPSRDSAVSHILIHEPSGRSTHQRSACGPIDSLKDAVSRVQT